MSLLIAISRHLLRARLEEGHGGGYDTLPVWHAAGVHELFYGMATAIYAYKRLI